MARFDDAALLADVTARFREAGFEEVEVDPEGYRQGALNELDPPAARSQSSVSGR